MELTFVISHDYRHYELRAYQAVMRCMASNCQRVTVYVINWPLQWRHNGRDSVLNQQPRECLFRPVINDKSSAHLHLMQICILYHFNAFTLLYSIYINIMDSLVTSSNGNIFRVTDHLCGNSPVPGEFPAQSQWCGALMFSFMWAQINGRVNNREVGHLRRHGAIMTSL